MKWLTIEVRNNFDILLNEIKKLDTNFIKLNNVLYNIEDPTIRIEYDYLGNKLEKPFFISTKNDKIKEKFDKELNLNVFEIFDAANDIKIYYNRFSMHYVGYRQKSSSFKN